MCFQNIGLLNLNEKYIDRNKRIANQVHNKVYKVSYGQVEKF
jgi:hypothetical protein